jgi:hypothetical protein
LIVCQSITANLISNRGNKNHCLPDLLPDRRLADLIDKVD